MLAASALLTAMLRVVRRAKGMSCRRKHPDANHLATREGTSALNA